MTGLNTKCLKFPVDVIRVKDDKQFKMSTAQVQFGIK